MNFEGLSPCGESPFSLMSDPTRQPNVVLLGFMGTGKSTAGRLVAKQLGLRFVDMDDQIEARAGKSISAIFAQEGESAFRKLERDLVMELAGGQGQVIACGGGVVLDRANLEAYGRHGVLFCLKADPDTILRRVARARHRPLLEDGEKQARILELLENRQTLYNAVPNGIDTAKLTPEEVAERIVAIYRKATALPPAG